MRIISGIAGGLKLQTLDGDDTRPTLDNVKEAIFSMLFLKCRDASVLDLFGGSGAMGIESLSRGSKSAVFVDCSAKACSVIKENLSRAKMTDRATVLNTDFARYLKQAGEKGLKFDLIFLDPPYASDFMDAALKAIYDYKLLAEGGYIICEFDSTANVDIKNYTLLKDKRYGRVCVNILEALS